MIIFKYWKAILSGLICGALFFSLGKLYGEHAGYREGYNKASMEVALQATKEAQTDRKTHATLEREIVGLPDPVLDARLDKWMRD